MTLELTETLLDQLRSRKAAGESVKALKGCEQSLGISRPDGLDGVDGFMAVRLWQAHLRGDHRALPALLRYNVEDTVNLRWLMDTAYNMAVSELPVAVPKMAVAALSQIDMVFDAEIIRELKHDSPSNLLQARCV